MTLSHSYGRELARVLSDALGDVAQHRADLVDGQAKLAAVVLGSPRPFDATKLAVGSLGRVALRVFGILDTPTAVVIKPRIAKVTIDHAGTPTLTEVNIDDPEHWSLATFLRSMARLHDNDPGSFCDLIDQGVQADVDRARKLLDDAFEYVCSIMPPCTCGEC